MALTNQRNTFLAYGVWISAWATLFMAGPQDHYLFFIFLAATYALFLGDKLHFLNRDYFIEVAGGIGFLSMFLGIYSETGFFLAAGMLIGFLIMFRKD